MPGARESDVVPMDKAMAYGAHTGFALCSRSSPYSQRRQLPSLDVWEAHGQSLGVWKQTPIYRANFARFFSSFRCIVADSGCTMEP